MTKTILVTGGCGFIGSNFLRYIREKEDWRIINIDKLTYAGASWLSLGLVGEYFFTQSDIGNSKVVKEILNRYRPDYIVNFAAETHVDRSIDNPHAFLDTNVVSTYNFIEEVQRYYDTENAEVRFVHISTDEVYGSLTPEMPSFTEETPYKPRNPYSATKAFGDHLISAFNNTYKLPAIITNCSNNYGPYQFPEKFIPVVILNAFQNKPVPVYGTGSNIRDWIYVRDHCTAVYNVCLNGKIGDKYNIGSRNEVDNLTLAKKILQIMGKPESLIKFVEDRKGHDLRYSMDSTKIRKELGWKEETDFDGGLEQTVKWYHDNMGWVNKCLHSE